MFWFWKFLLRRMAKAQGFSDPVTVFSDLKRFARPAEVWVPTELLRSGALMQVRGLLNTQVIQHNNDWVWPYWAEEQFNPASTSFIPHALSPTHINLTHRNWTALGLPGMAEYPIIDPRGLATPFYDGWSIDAWVSHNGDKPLLPSRCADVRQAFFAADGTIGVETVLRQGEFVLESKSRVVADASGQLYRMTLKASAPAGSKLAVVLRPYNPEGVSFINKIDPRLDGAGFVVDDKKMVRLDKTPSHYLFSDYERGDVYGRLSDGRFPEEESKVHCRAGMASAAALYNVGPGSVELTVEVPLNPAPAVSTWRDALAGVCRIEVPDALYQRLFETAVYSLILHSPDDVYPGPYMYRRFWFRDAAFILHAMTCLNMTARVEKSLDRFAARQTPTGYFLSQNGEWDSNGQALWILERFCRMHGRPAKKEWRDAVLKGGEWIVKKRTKKDDSPSGGLLPAGFSAEHFGPSDNYYWDDFWGAAGLCSAGAMARQWGDADKARRFEDESVDLMECIDEALRKSRHVVHSRAVPPTPHRRLDGGSIGALVSTYPLQLWETDDPRLRETIDYLLKHCMIRNGFYQKIGHAGINAYLSLSIAQSLLRAGDRSFEPIVDAVARLASPTGQWPEAVHPRTGGGCMGDGQHLWAAAEWIMILRNYFVREEEKTATLVIGSGLPAAWLEAQKTMFIGPVRTLYGEISITIGGGASPRVSWEAVWHSPPKKIVVRLAGFPEKIVGPQETSVEMRGSAA